MRLANYMCSLKLISERAFMCVLDSLELYTLCMCMYVLLCFFIHMPSCKHVSIIRQSILQKTEKLHVNI